MYKHIVQYLELISFGISILVYVLVLVCLIEMNSAKSKKKVDCLFSTSWTLDAATQIF